MKRIDLTEAHEHASNNKSEVLNSKLCGCFYCGEIFEPAEIKNWINDTKQPTAQCPYCFVDSVIGDASGNPITKPFLSDMHKKWFQR